MSRADQASGARERAGDADSPDLAFGADAPLTDVMRTMRAMRRVKPDPVPREVLERLVEAATWAPSGGNHQQYSWLVVTDRAKMRQLAELWRECHDFYVATVGHDPPATIEPAKYERHLRTLRFQREHFHETPAVIVACYDLSGVRREAARHAPRLLRAGARAGLRRGAILTASLRRAGDMSEAASVYPGVQNLLLQARAEGLAATLTTWHLFFEREFKKVLGIPRAVRTFAIVPVGYPRGNFGPVVRRPVSEAIRWDGW